MYMKNITVPHANHLKQKRNIRKDIPLLFYYLCAIIPPMADISNNNRSYLAIFSWSVCRLSLRKYNKK